MSEMPEPHGRRGGRSARKALRAAPLAEDLRPVRAGLTGGLYKPLSDGDVARIHAAVLDVLETIGFADAIPSCVEQVTALGGFVNEDGRLCLPRALVEDVIAAANRNFVLCGQDPRHDLHPFGGKVHFGTGGAAVHMVNLETNTYRDSTLADLYDMARVVDALDHIHFFQRPVTARDMVGGHDLDINTAYACIAGTTKHIGTSFVAPDHVREILSFLHLVAGGEDRWRARPFVSQSNCFVVPPLKFATDACRCLEAAVHGGMPVLLLSAGQAGATAPASLSGSVVQAMAECLGGLIYVNAVKKGAPAILGPWPFVSDLRTGAMSGGSGEQALLMAACAQMGNHYGLATGVASGMTDSKLPDIQAGAEKGYNHALVANAGATLIYECAGMHASLLGTCMESFVIDNDICGAALRTVRGLEVDDDALSIDVIRDVCVGGPGHYLGHRQTLSLMQSDYVYPAVGDRMSPKEWEEVGKPAVLDWARDLTRQILATHYPDHIPPDIDDRIRAGHDIKLPRSVMRPPRAA